MNELPLFSDEAIEYIKSYLKIDHVVFEYGSGYSTLYISRLCKKIISIEHNKLWFVKIKKEINKNHINNIELYFCCPDKVTDESFRSHRTQKSFKNYVLKILNWPRGYFDMIIIDGRARPSCVEHSISRLKNGGILLLDNSDRIQYRECFDLLDNFNLIISSKNHPFHTRIYKKN